MKVRRVLLALLAIGLVVGGCTSIGGGNMVVTDALRQSCGNYHPTDSEILYDLAQVQWDRENGSSKAVALSIALAGCRSGDEGAACRSCWLAVVDQIYGQ